VALAKTIKTIHGITGIEIIDVTVKVDSGTGKISDFHSTIKIAFGVEHS